VPASKSTTAADDTKKALAKLDIFQGWVGQAKGVKEALHERGLWKAGMYCTKCAAVLKVKSCLIQTCWSRN